MPSIGHCFKTQLFAFLAENHPVLRALNPPDQTRHPNPFYKLKIGIPVSIWISTRMFRKAVINLSWYLIRHLVSRVSFYAVSRKSVKLQIHNTVRTQPKSRVVNPLYSI